MKRSFARRIGAAMLGAALVATGVWAQQPASPGGANPGHMGPGMTPHGQMPHGPGHGSMVPGGAAAAGVPTSPGQDAFGAIGEIVRLDLSAPDRPVEETCVASGFWGQSVALPGARGGSSRGAPGAADAYAPRALVAATGRVPDSAAEAPTSAPKRRRAAASAVPDGEPVATLWRTSPLSRFARRALTASTALGAPAPWAPFGRGQ